MNEQKATPINQLGSLCAPGIGEVWCGVTGTVSPPSPAKKLSCRFNELPINRTDWDCVSVCVCVYECCFFCSYQAQKRISQWKKIVS